MSQNKKGAVRIIPCLDVKDGRVVKGVNFVSLRDAGDPAARSFISGPQGPSAYGGNNWALQGPAYSGLMSYSYGGLEEILHSFAPETLDLPWILGYANYEGKVCYELWRSLQLRARGAMAFSAASMIRSDYSLSRSGEAAAKFLPEIS